ncbi:unnamed protein product [Adineta ricciae]|uniref:Uncharacterized protein n=1 Tax=Adineta ricciae TaxID=249248 RepID=A0A814KG48_ADIRI|nr:unnamed protein product [Adineta ricciae]
MTHVQQNSECNDFYWQSHSSPIPLMSVSVPPTAFPSRLSSSCQTSISEPICSSPTAPTSIIIDNISLTSTVIHQIDISKYYFAHVIKVPHGTNLLASNNQTTTLCVNSVDNIIHLITPTGYNIRSLRWPNAEEIVEHLFWCDTIQSYLAMTSKSLYTLQYNTNQSFRIEKSLGLPSKPSSTSNLIACNSYRLYIYNQSIEIYTLQFNHLHTKQLPKELNQHEMKAFTCSDSYLIFYYEHLTNKFAVLDSTTLTIKYQFELSYQNISSLHYLDENTLTFIGVRKDGKNRVILYQFNDDEECETQPVIMEKSINQEQQIVQLLPNCHDLIILNVDSSRVQYLKCRS